LPSGDQARHLVFERMIGDLGEWSAVGADHPDVLVVAAFVFLAGAVGDERNA
jgi:hypothetical protein